MKSILTVTTLSLLCLSCKKATSGQKGPVPYPLDTCIVSDKPLYPKGEQIILEYNGHEIKFCSKDCKPKFLINPDIYVQKLVGK
jgi:YHS domain-containing protein